MVNPRLMNTIMMIGSVIGFAPALYLIWHSLHKYSYPHVEGSLFEDRRVFFMLAVGMVLGALLFVFELTLYPMFTSDTYFIFVSFVLVYVLAFPLLEDLAKFIILNFKGYRGIPRADPGSPRQIIRIAGNSRGLESQESCHEQKAHFKGRYRALQTANIDSRISASGSGAKRPKKR
jgi:hypothetical protein